MRAPSRRASSWSTSGSSSSESTRALWRRCSTRPLFDCVTAQAVADERIVEFDAVCGGDRQVAIRAGSGNAITASRAPINSRNRATDELKAGAQLDLLDQRADHLVQRLKLARPARRGLVQPCVLDRDCRLCGEQRDDLLVLGRERLAACSSRSNRGCRRRLRASSPGPRGTSPSTDGSAGTRPTADRRPASRGGAGVASLISTPRMPRPRGSAPIAACCSVSIPVVTNRSSAPPDSSITPSAA